MDELTPEHITPELVEKALTAEQPVERVLMAARDDFTPTPEQFERGLTDEWAAVRYVFAARKDFTPTNEQLKRGLNDPDLSVRSMFQMFEANELKTQTGQQQVSTAKKRVM